MVSLLLLVEVLVIQQFELVLSCMQTTSQSLATQLNKPKMNASKVGLKINFKKTKILHAGHNSQPSPVTTINGYTLEVCNDFLYLGVSTKTPLSVVQEKIG